MTIAYAIGAIIGTVFGQITKGFCFALGCWLFYVLFVAHP